MGHISIQLINSEDKQYFFSCNKKQVINMQFSFALVTLLATVSFMEIDGVSAEIGADPFSLFKILFRLCVFPGDHSDPIAKQFYGCYDKTPEQKARFSLCQVEAFGNILDTKSHIDVSCKKAWLLDTYVKCLKREFGTDELSKAVEIINKCQADVVGAE